MLPCFKNQTRQHIGLSFRVGITNKPFIVSKILGRKSSWSINPDLYFKQIKQVLMEVLNEFFYYLFFFVRFFLSFDLVFALMNFYLFIFSLTYYNFFPITLPLTDPGPGTRPGLNILICTTF